MVGCARRWTAAVLVVLLGAAIPAWAQTPTPAPEKKDDTKPEEKKEEEKKPATLWEETKLFAYVEFGATFNLTGAGRGGTNELRLYDNLEGFTPNMVEFSIKKDPSEKYPFGWGLTLAAGRDAQKNHSLGIFRGDTDAFAYRNTPWFDLEEAYGSVMIPLGSGITLKGGKFVTLLGYEVIESPNNLNYSRGYLFALAIPLTHTGGLVSYTFTDWFTMTVGGVLGWDNSKENNGAPSATGQFAFTPIKDFTANMNWIVGPEQADNNSNIRFVLDWVFAYTGIKGLTLAVNIDYGHEDNEAFLTSLGTRQNTDAKWAGFALYGAYDWTDWFRTALRQEYFVDVHGARSGFGNHLELFSTTVTAQFKIWKGLNARAEYRHDSADRKVFKARTTRPDASGGVVPQSKSLDTFSVSLYYLFF